MRSQGRNSPPPPYTEKSQSFSSDSVRCSESSSVGENHGDGIACGLSAHQDPLNPFAFTPTQLVRLVERKDIKTLSLLGGAEGVARGLHSHVIHGLSPEREKHELQPVSLHDVARASASSSSPNEVARNQRSNGNDTDGIAGNKESDLHGAFFQRMTVFGSNVLPCIKHKTLMALMWEAFQDKTLILLTVSAVISLSVGLYEDLTSVEYDSSGNRVPAVKWVEGVAIIVAVLLVVLVSSINDYQKEKQFQRLNAKKQDRKVNAFRSRYVQISVHDIQAGDVLFIRPGDILAADGILIEGKGLVKCDESAATGESDAVRKAELRDCLLLDETQENELLDSGSHGPDPFLISGAKVLEGEGTYLVTAVGEHSMHGKILMALRTKAENTPLQEKLNCLAGNIAKLGVSAAGVLFIILLVRCVLSYATTDMPNSASDVVSQLMRILITTVTTVVVAVPEGLPLAVTLALAYATQRMLKDNNLVRVLAACETMGNATTICSDKTGTLTQNRMAVVAGTFGSSFRFLKDPPTSRADLIDLDAVRYRLPLPVRNFLNQAMSINSSALTSTDPEGKTALIGNKTETAILSFAQESMGCEPVDDMKSRWKVEHVYPFNSARKCMATVVRIVTWDEHTKQDKTVYRLHIKGASEMLLNAATHIVSMHAASYDRFQGVHHGDSYDIETRIMTDSNRARMGKIIQSYATRCLRTLALCYRDFDSWDHLQNVDDVLADGSMTLLGIVGIEDPLRPGVRAAVAACQQAGVCVRMVTGDNMLTAKSIARQCGIYTPGGKVLDGPAFRQLSDIERLRVLPELQVLARSSPEDKRLLVQGLRELGNTVAVTGDGTNDGPALKAADVGFAMGVSGTEVAKEASSIILMDDNFSSIVRAISWGRCVNDSVKKFLQFQLTVNVTAVVLTLVSAVTSNDQQSVLTAVQLLWVNLIMDTFAALALATDPPTPSLLKRRPEPRTAPLIGRSMWKMIVGQAIYQIIVILTLMYTDILNLGSDKATLTTMVFTAFVFCQIFNEVNCRRIDNRFNVFKGITKNRFFMGIFFVTIAGQVLIVQFGGAAFQTVPLRGMHWLLCIVVGFMSLPVGALIRLIPDELLESHAPPPPPPPPMALPANAYIVPIPTEDVLQRVACNARESAIKEKHNSYRGMS